VAAFGAALALMNLCFYLAIARLPLGTAVAIEFAGPIAVAALGSRTRRDAAALTLAVLGVLALADVRFSGAPGGVALALAAGALLPARAPIVGAIVLGQVPGLVEAGGIALVVVASSLRSHDQVRQEPDA